MAQGLSVNINRSITSRTLFLLEQNSGDITPSAEIATGNSGFSVHGEKTPFRIRQTYKWYECLRTSLDRSKLI